MALVLVQAPLQEPIGVDEAKRHAGATHDADDQLFADLIARARADIERVSERRIVTQTWKLTFDEWPEGDIELPEPPLQSVDSIAYLDTAEPPVEQTVAESVYEVDASGQFGVVSLADGQVWPVASGGIEITFVAGVLEVADDVKGILRQAVAYLYQNREMPDQEMLDRIYSRFWIGRL